MIKEAIEKIIDLNNNIEIKEVEGIPLSKQKLYPVIPDIEPPPVCLEVNTLTGVVDYVLSKNDKAEKYLIHAYSPNEVNLYGEFEPNFGRRKKYLTAVCPVSKFQFGYYQNQENFLIGLQSEFSETEDRDLVIESSATIAIEENVRTDDDGIKQTMTIKSGIKRLSTVVVPSPVSLAPYRSFSELEQVRSNFIFRIKKNADKQPEFALFEVQSEIWKLQAIQNIKAYLSEKLKGVSIIA